MKFFLALVALVGFASSADLDDLEACKLFLECARKAMDGGVPSIPVPNHNPLTIRDVTYSGKKLLTSYSIGVTDNTLSNLVDFNVTDLSATNYKNPERVAYDYNVYWPQLVFSGKFDVNISTWVLHKRFKGTYKIAMREVNWSGVFNLTKPGQEKFKEHLDDFTLNSETDDVEVTIEGVNGAIALAVEESLELGLSTLMNHFPATAGEFLKETRFNGFWLAHPEKINEVMAFCKQ